MPTSLVSTLLMPALPIATRLSPVDLAVVGLYLIGITLFGLRFSRKQDLAPVAGKTSLERYFLAGNTIPWWAIALSIVSAETSTLTIISIPGVAFAGDLGFLQVVLGYLLGRVVVAMLFLPRYFRGEMLTAYQLIERRFSTSGPFGNALYKLTAGLFLLTRAAAEGVRVFAISIVVGIAIGTNDVLSIGLISALTLLYTFEGGMAAVIWTDVVQMGLYLAGTIVALITLGHQVPGGWPSIHEIAAPLGKFHWLDFTWSITKSYTFWAGILGGTFLTMASHGTDQLMVQRMLAARNLNAARTALLSSGVVIFIQFALFLVIGVGLFVFYGGAGAPSIASAAMGGVKNLSPDRIFPIFIVRQMPHGIAGLLVAAILAAAMSNLSAALNSLASTTVVDFYLPWRARARHPIEGIDEKERTRVARAATIFWAFVLFAIAVYSIQAGGKGHVVETGLSIASVAYGSLLGVFLLGTLTRYATQIGAIVGMIAGLATNLYLWLTPTAPHVAFTWYVLIGAIVTFAIGSLFSLNRKAFPLLLLLLLGVPFLRASSAWMGRKIPPGQAFLTPTHRDQAAMNGAPRSVDDTRYDFSPVSAAITKAIAEKKLPGAVVIIGHGGKIVFEQAYGNRALEPKVEPMTTDTIFDMASLTKVLATTTAVLQLYEQRKLDLDAPVAKYLPEFAQNGKDKITIRELMTHYSGLPEDVSLKDDWGLNAPDKAEGIRRAMAAVPYGPPGMTFKYSDINFITLGALVEKLSDQPLDAYADQHIFRLLGMRDTRYHAFSTACGPKKVVGSAIEYADHNNGYSCSGWAPLRTIPVTAPTAHDDQGTAATNPDFDHLLRGTVHDPTTRRMGGVAGHAGVFSTAEDIAKFAQALLDKLLRNTGPFPLMQATLKQATSPNEPATAVNTATIFTQSGEPTKGVASRGLGWDLNSAFSRPRGSIFPITTAGHPGSFGHTGFTGTSLWIDPTSDTYVILLANAIHPRGAPPISPLRGEVATAAAKALGLAHEAGDPERSPAEPGKRVALSPGTSPATPPPTGAPSIPAPPEWVGSLNLNVLVPTHRDKTAMNGAPHERSPAEPNDHLALSPGTSPATLSPTSAPSIPASPEWVGSLNLNVLVPTHRDKTAMNGAPKVLRTSFQAAESRKTLTGIDLLEESDFAALKALAATHGGRLRIGLLTNQSGLDSSGKRTIDILFHADPSIELKTLFTPEHGLFGKQDTEHLAAERDTLTNLPVISLYGARPADRHPRISDLKELDAVVLDLQDAGVRTYTYETLTGYFLEACHEAHIPLVVLDRPNPIGGLEVQGSLPDPGQDSYTDFMPIPLRHGLTLGELARFFNEQATETSLQPELLNAGAVRAGGPDTSGSTGRDDHPPSTTPGIHANLVVVPMQHWRRDEYFDQTGLTFTPPSPNLRTVAAATLLPALTLVETTNLSVGRGSATPFEAVGASYLDARALAAYLEARQIPGVKLTAETLTIAEDQNHYPGHGQTIPAVRFQVTDRAAFDSPEFGLELLAALHKLYPKDFQLERAKTLLANAAVLKELREGTDPRSIAARYAPADDAFRRQRAPYLLYR